MLSIRKINPMARAIGTMGVVMGLVGAVTFAVGLTSNTVALSPNNLSSSTAQLLIGAGNGNSCSNGGLANVPGLNTNLTPGVTSAALPFCLFNTGQIPLALTASIPNRAPGVVPDSAVTLTITCQTGTATGTITAFETAGIPLGTLNNATPEDCNVTALLAASFTSTGGGETVAPFDIDFVGTQVPQE